MRCGSSKTRCSTPTACRGAASSGFWRRRAPRFWSPSIGGRITGAAVVLFRANSAIARLYSLAVAPRLTGRGIGSALITAVEKAARTRKCRFVRLEVHEKNHGAIVCYRKAGYAAVRPSP